MSIVLSTPPYQQFYDSNGDPLNGGLVYTYVAGTSFSTPAATYTDQGGLTQSANPIVLDSAGRAVWWLDSTISYGYVVKDSSGATIKTVDVVTPFTAASGLANIGTIAANTIIGNNTGSVITPLALTVAQVQTMLNSVAGLSGANLVGTTTNDNAATGQVGELIESEILIGSAVSLTSTVAANITSISLTAGDWDVWGTIFSNPAGGTTTSVIIGAINTTSATVPTAPNKGGHQQLVTAIGAGLAQGIAGMKRRYSFASTTTVYLVANMTFATSTMSAYGYLGARRRR